MTNVFLRNREIENRTFSGAFWIYPDSASVGLNYSLNQGKPYSCPFRIPIQFLKKAENNQLDACEDVSEVIRKLLACLIKPFVEARWWEKMLTLVHELAREIPCYTLSFDRGGGVADLMHNFAQQRALAKDSHELSDAYSDIRERGEIGQLYWKNRCQ